MRNAVGSRARRKTLWVRVPLLPLWEHDETVYHDGLQNRSSGFESRCSCHRFRMSWIDDRRRIFHKDAGEESPGSRGEGAG